MRDAPTTIPYPEFEIECSCGKKMRVTWDGREKYKPVMETNWKPGPGSSWTCGELNHSQANVRVLP